MPNTIDYVNTDAFHDCWSIEKFDTQGRYNDINWANFVIDYMSSVTISWDYLKVYRKKPTNEHIDYLLELGIVS